MPSTSTGSGENDALGLDEEVAQVPAALPPKFPGFHLQTLGTGVDQCLQMWTNKTGKRLHARMDQCAPVTVQFWTLEPSEVKGFCRIHLTSTETDQCLTHTRLAFTGGLQGFADKATIEPCGKAANQLWELTPVTDEGWAKRDLYHLRSKDSADNFCLTYFPESKLNTEVMQNMACKAGRGQQMWRVSMMYTVLAR